LTAVVLDSSNNILPNVTVQFSAARDSTVSSCGSGGALQVLNSGLTNAAGQAQAVLYTGGDTTNQTIKVTATAGTATPATIQIVEAGTKLTLTGPSAVGLSGNASYTIALADAGNNPISNTGITVTSAKSNSVALGNSGKSDANGQLMVTYGATNSGADTLTAQPTICASSSNIATASIQVATQNLAIVSPNSNSQIPFAGVGTLSIGASVASGGTGYVIGDVLTVSGGTSTVPAQLTVSSIGTSGVITAVNVTNAGTYTVIPSSPAAVTGGSGTGATSTVTQNITVKLTGGANSGKTIQFNTTRGILSATSALTDGSGVATVGITQPTGAGHAGGALITATCTNCSPAISTSANVQFNATVAGSVTMQASPSSVAISGTSAITATVRDPNNNPAANQLVQFTLPADNSGGSLLQSSAMTNSNGQATITYKAGGISSSANGVTVTGTIGAVSGSTNLTVGGLSLRIALGTGNSVSALNSTQYQFPYSVLVTDAGGNPPPAGSTVSLVVNAVAYQKGHWYPVQNGWNQHKEIDCTTDQGCATTRSYGCFNEDLNLNGILDSADNDYNGNGKLEPGNDASVPSSVVLDPTGTGQFSIIYHKDRAFWIQVFVTATITVNGDQGTTTAVFELPGLSGDYTNPAVAPPGVISPFGDVGGPSAGNTGTDICLNPPPN